jgi:hypothetical protein
MLYHSRLTRILLEGLPTAGLTRAVSGKESPWADVTLGAAKQ